MMHVKLYQDIARYCHIATAYAHPVMVKARYFMDPSPTPKFDNFKLHMSSALQLFGAGANSAFIRCRPPRAP
jgi:alpha-D-ribose 1-methylphosphonate 5-phosphate C-P lyase